MNRRCSEGSRAPGRRQTSPGPAADGTQAPTKQTAVRLRVQHRAQKGLTEVTCAEAVSGEVGMTRKNMYLAKGLPSKEKGVNKLWL